MIIFEASFPYINLSNDGDRGWFTRASRNLDNEKGSYIIRKTVITNDKIIVTKLLFCFKEGDEGSKKVYFKNLIETSENKTKTMWNLLIG